jgi:hypothetical protein
MNPSPFQASGIAVYFDGAHLIELAGKAIDCTEQ